MKVLSLFDGISCGMVALERAGIPVERYVAYEIEPSAIAVSKHNYPMIEQEGDAFEAEYPAPPIKYFTELDHIDRWVYSPAECSKVIESSFS